MGRHRRPSNRKKVAPSIVLGVSVLSVVSPLAGIFTFAPNMAPKAEATTTPDIPFEALPTGKLSPAAVVAEARAKISVPRALPTSSKRPQIHTQTTKAVPVSTPTVAVSTKPHPTVAQRQAQAAPKSTVTIQRTTTSTSASPKPHIVTQTTTTTPPMIKPSTITTTAKPKAVPIPPLPPPTTSKATTKPIPKPTLTPPPPPPIPSPSSTTTTTTESSIVSTAKKYVGRGIPYKMGGNSLTRGMDCSHFVWLVLKEVGLDVGYRNSEALASWTKRVENPRVGDLVLFKGHVGFYVSEGMMIDQGSSGGAHLQQIKHVHNFIGYGRLPI